MDRRAFLSRVVGAFSIFITGLLGLPIFRFISASLAEEQASWYPIGLARDIPEGVSRVTFDRVVRDGWLSRPVEEYVWVHKKPDGSVVVFEPHCTHLGCAYDWNEKAAQFQCPCHGGKFNADGTRIAGPPPRPLDRFELRWDDGVLKIRKLLKS